MENRKWLDIPEAERIAILDTQVANRIREIRSTQSAIDAVMYLRHSGLSFEECSAIAKKLHKPGRRPLYATSIT